MAQAGTLLFLPGCHPWHLAFHAGSWKQKEAWVNGTSRPPPGRDQLHLLIALDGQLA